jgi:hypothetical protein
MISRKASQMLPKKQMLPKNVVYLVEKGIVNGWIPKLFSAFEKSLLKTLMFSEFGQNRQSIQLKNSQKQFLYGKSCVPY